jgi:hypothetical protein
MLLLLSDHEIREKAMLDSFKALTTELPYYKNPTGFKGYKFLIRYETFFIDIENEEGRI